MLKDSSLTPSIKRPRVPWTDLGITVGVITVGAQVGGREEAGHRRAVVLIVAQGAYRAGEERKSAVFLHHKAGIAFARTQVSSS